MFYHVACSLWPHFLHVLLPLHLAGSSSDSTLFLPSILSTLKILPSYWPVSFLLTIRATHFHSVKKTYSTAVLGLQVHATTLCSHLNTLCIIVLGHGDETQGSLGLASCKCGWKPRTPGSETERSTSTNHLGWVGPTAPSQNLGDPHHCLKSLWWPLPCTTADTTPPRPAPQSW